MSSSKGVILIPPLSVDPNFFPATWSPAGCCFLHLQISEGRDALTHGGGPSWLWKPHQLPRSLRSALLASWGTC